MVIKKQKLQVNQLKSYKLCTKTIFILYRKVKTILSFFGLPKLQSYKMFSDFKTINKLP